MHMICNGDSNITSHGQRTTSAEFVEQAESSIECILKSSQKFKFLMLLQQHHTKLVLGHLTSSSLGARYASFAACFGVFASRILRSGFVVGLGFRAEGRLTHAEAAELGLMP